MDIVERLRGPESVTILELEAADEIERLRQQNAELVEEIKKLKQAKEINKYDTHYPDDGFGGYPSVYNRR